MEGRRVGKGRVRVVEGGLICEWQTAERNNSRYNVRSGYVCINTYATKNKQQTTSTTLCQSARTAHCAYTKYSIRNHIHTLGTYRHRHLSSIYFIFDYLSIPPLSTLLSNHTNRPKPQLVTPNPLFYLILLLYSMPLIFVLQAGCAASRHRCPVLFHPPDQQPFHPRASQLLRLLQRRLALFIHQMRLGPFVEEVGDHVALAGGGCSDEGRPASAVAGVDGGTWVGVTGVGD